jgi:hypothetical protein
MAIGTRTREVMAFSMGDRAAAVEVANLIDSHGAGTLSVRTKNVLRAFFGSLADARNFIAAVTGHTALAATDVAKLGQSLRSRKAATVIAAELLI